MRLASILLLRLTVKDKKINGISHEYLESVNEEGAGLRIVGKEIN